MHTMSRFAICLTAIALVACKKSEPVADTTAAAGAVVPTPAPVAAINLADVAGTWTVVSTPLDGADTTTTTWVLVTTADTTGWTRTSPGAKPVAVHVRTDADSIITTAGPFPSTRRKGVQVTTNAVLRRQGDRLVGTSTAHYKTTGPDSVMHSRLEGTKKP